MILGIDEVGRGAWAGPLVVGAVVLGEAQIDGLTDSKALTKKRREEFAKQIREQAAGVGLGWVSAEEIDEIGLSQALRLATKRAVKEVQEQDVSFHEIIIDGTINFLSDTPLASYVSTMKKADLLISSVSAASIVAKVARDEYMREQAEHYPEYGFAEHVGYGTAKHRAEINEHGVTPLHRLSITPMQKYDSEHSRPQHTQNRRKNSLAKSLDSAELGRGLKQSSNRKDLPRKFFGISRNAANENTPAITTRDIGNASEDAAARELERRGHTTLERNWRTKFCEIDIVSKKDDVYYFTEVKHRKNSDAGDGLAAITPKKLKQMKFAAEVFVQKHNLTNTDIRLVAIATVGSDTEIERVIEIQ